MKDENLIVFPTQYEPPTKVKPAQIDAAEVQAMFTYLADEIMVLSKALQSLVTQLKRK